MRSLILSTIKCLVIGVNLAIGLILLAKWLVDADKPETNYSYKGKGMALCHTKVDSEKAEDTITLEFKRFQIAEKNTFTFILRDNSKVIAFAPCLINFDKEA